MSVVSVCQEAAAFLGISIPAVVVGATDREVIELRATLNEAAAALAEAHPWQTLTTLQSYSGDGSTEAFALPSDYHFMPKDSQLWTTRLDGPMYHVVNPNDWREINERNYEFVRGVWTLIGDEILIKPAPESSETVTFYYQSRSVWDGAAKTAEPVADTDTFRLNDRLLKLGIIWNWRQYKGLSYAEDMQTYEHALADAIERDRGARVLKRGPGRVPGGLRTAYPQAIKS